MRFKKPYIASLGEVTIEREWEYAVIEYPEPDVGKVNLKIGPEVQEMTDEEILTLHMEEFGKVLSCFAGWGMRVTVVPENQLEKEPEIDVREPKEEWPRVH